MNDDLAEYFGKDQIAKWKSNIESERRTNFLNNRHLDEAVQIVNAIIKNSLYSNKDSITLSDVKFTDNFLSDREDIERKEVTEEDKRTIEITFSIKRTLSNILFNIYFPKPKDLIYYHYTKISALRNILRGELRLKSLVSNENYDEFKTFYIEHDILGYFENRDYEGTLMKDALMKETYAFCMASKVGLGQENEKSLWNSFADNGRGVRIEFEVKSDHSDFRTIFYRDQNFDVDVRDLVINRLNSVLKNLYKRQLFVSGISKIGAFYLPGQYKIENEVRFVVKKHTDEYQFDFDDSKGYITLPFKSNFGTFTIKAIKIGLECNTDQRAEIEEMIALSNLSSDIIVE